MGIPPTRVTPLYLAAHNGHRDAIAILIEAGVDIDMCIDKKDGPALYCAVRNVDIRASELLIEAGADCNKTMSGSPLPIIIAIAWQSEELVRMLIDGGADVNLRSRNRHTYPIHIAASERSISILDMLIEAGADISQVDEDNNTPLHLSISNDIEMTKRLIRVGARMDIEGKYGRTPKEQARICWKIDLSTLQ